MYLGGHFQVGYVWALPEGGYEFGGFWAAMIAVFAVLGGALGQKQTCAAQKSMSALPPKADMCSATRHVCFVPIADILASQRDVRSYLESGHLLASIEYPLKSEVPITY